jgi:hypothetical protein
VTPIPFVSILVDGFFMRLLGWKRMYQVLFINVMAIYISKFQTLWMSAQLWMGSWALLALVMFCALMPVEALLAMGLIVAFNFIYRKIFRTAYRRINQV